MSLHSKHIILIKSQPVLSLCGEATHTNFTLWFDPTGARTHYLPHSRLELNIYRTRGSNSLSTALEARTHYLPHSRLELTIYRTRGSNSLSTVLEARTHYLPNSRLELTIYRNRGSNSLFTVLEASTLTITPPMRFPCWK